jgi:hypothetical protein
MKSIAQPTNQDHLLQLGAERFVKGLAFSISFSHSDNSALVGRSVGGLLGIPLLPQASRGGSTVASRATASWSGFSPRWAIPI